MTKGAVLIAQNNSSIDYIKMATFAATRIKQYLEIPVSLITDDEKWLQSNFANHPFDKVISLEPNGVAQHRKFHDGSLTGVTAEWKNFSRNYVYDLSPYDRTIVLDTDYILNSSVLKPALDNDYEFQIYRNSFDLISDRDPGAFKRINPYSIPFYWATVFIFDKTPMMRAFFDMVEYIKQNWIYFRTLYTIDAPHYRNDTAFSIAIHIFNGKTEGEFTIELPGKMIYTSDRDILVSTDGNKMKFLVEKKNHLGEYTLVKTTGLDVHVMNKFSLNRYIDGGVGV
jgi:hypothetical protein